MESSLKSKPKLGRSKKSPAPILNAKINSGIAQVPLNVENSLSKISKLSKVSLISANSSVEVDRTSNVTKTDITKVKPKNSLKLKGISIPALYNIVEIDKLKEGMRIDKEAMRTDTTKNKGIQVQKVKPFIQQNTVKTNDNVKNIKAFIPNKVDILEQKSESVKIGHELIKVQDEEDSDLIKNIKQIIQQKPESIDEGDCLKDIKPMIDSKIGVSFGAASNSEATINIIDASDDDDSDIEIEEINIVKSKEPQTTNFQEGGSIKQDEFIKTIMKQVEELETTLGSQIKQKNEELLKERELIEQLKRKNSILEQKDKERKLSVDKNENKISELGKTIEKQQKAVEMLKESVKLKDEECKTLIVKQDSKTKALDQMLSSKEKELKILNENWKLKEKENKFTIEKHENETKELLNKVSQKDTEMELLNKKCIQTSDDLKNLRKVSDKQLKKEKENMKKLSDKNLKETATLNKQITALEKNIQESNVSIVDLNETIDSLNKKLAKKGDLVNGLKEKVEKLISEFTKGYKDKDAIIESKTQKVLELTEKANNLEIKVSDLEQDVTKKVNEIQFLTQDKEATATTMVNLQQELTIKATDLETKIVMNNRQVALISDLSKTVNKLENDVAVKDREILSLGKDLAVKVSDLETKNVMNKRQASILGDISKNLDDITKAKTILERSHTLLKTENQDLLTKFQSLEQSHQKTCFVKKVLQDSLNQIKTKKANKVVLTDDDIFEDKLEQTFYNSKRKVDIKDFLMITYNWPVLSIKVDPRALRDSKKENLKIIPKLYYIQGTPLMVTYLWPIVPSRRLSTPVDRGVKRRSEDNEDTFGNNKRLRLTEEGKNALYNSREENEDNFKLMYNLSVDSDHNLYKSSKSEYEKIVTQDDVEAKPLMLTYLWPVSLFHERLIFMPLSRGLKRRNEEDQEDSVSNKSIKCSIEDQKMISKRKLPEESFENKRIRLDRELIEKENVSVFVRYVTIK